MSKQFAIVYDTATKQIIRLIDTSDDKDDSHLEWVKQTIGPGQTMETFLCDQFTADPQFGTILPRMVAPHIGKGTIVAQEAIDAVAKPNAMLTPAPLTTEQIAAQKARQAALKAKMDAKTAPK